MRRWVAFGAGLAAGVMVTANLHGRAPSDFWARPVGTIPWRRADVPVGGVTALALAAVVPKAVGRSLRPLGWGAIVGCLAVGLLDPYRA